MQGSRRTPNVAIYFFHKSPYSPRFGPIIRMIADMAEQTGMLASLDTGIEQRAGSPYRADMMDLFHKGEYVTMHTPWKGSDWPTDLLLHIESSDADEKSKKGSEEEL